MNLRWGLPPAFALTSLFSSSRSNPRPRPPPFSTLSCSPPWALNFIFPEDPWWKDERGPWTGQGPTEALPRVGGGEVSEELVQQAVNFRNPSDFN